MKESLVFVGPGRAGLSLGYALWQAEALDRLTYYGRRPEPPSHPLFTHDIARYVFGLEPVAPGTTGLFLSVPDDVVSGMAAAVAAHGAAPPGCAAFHLSGVMGTDPLAPLHAVGYSVGTFHPLQSLANPVTGADLLPGSYVAVSGEPQAMSTAHRLLFHLGSAHLSVPEVKRPLYHAAAALASQAMTGLLATAVGVLIRAGVPDDEAVPALLKLAGGTLENMASLGMGPSLTGAVARGDSDTVRLHLRALEEDERRVYASLVRRLVDLAGVDGLEPDAAGELAALLVDEP